jgi:hypothetical protein
MKELIKRVGIVFVVAGVIILGIYEFSGMENNKILVISGGLILGGFIIYLFLNNLIE